MKWITDLLTVLPVTLGLWALSIIIGMALGIVIAVGRTSKLKFVRALAIGYIELFRGIPTLVWLFIIFFGMARFGFNATAFVSATITLGLVAAAYTAEIYRSGLQAVPRQQREATTALGLSKIVSLRLVLLPQAKPIILAGIGSFGVHLLKETALASLIGVVEIMSVANYMVERGANGINVLLIAGIIYMILCLPLAGLNKIFTPRKRKSADIHPQKAMV